MPSFAGHFVEVRLAAFAMDRQLEPEWMDTPAEAGAYDRMDHVEVNRQFVDDLLAAADLPAGLWTALDLGTGTARIPIELCLRHAAAQVVAVDAAEAMLDVARDNLAGAGLADRIALKQGDVKQLGQTLDEPFDVVMCNSLVHHLPEPRVLLAQAVRLVAPGGLLFFRDLFRPASEAELERLVGTYAGDAEPDQRLMLADSLRAALTVEEVRALVAELGFAPDTVRATSDRHWTWIAMAPDGTHHT